MIKLVTFLGNPGREHQQSRHNIGWMLADVARITKNLSWQKKFKGLYAGSTINSEKRFFLKPATFMNKSGESVQALLAFFKLTPDEMLVVHDDLELEFGQIRIKKGGGLGGHNGLRSIVQAVGTPEFHRLRLGISRPTHGNVAAYVLSAFSKNEQAMLPQYLEQAAEALTFSLTAGIEVAEQQFQKQVVINK